MQGSYEIDIENGSSSSSNMSSNVNEEYMETFRTKSYVEIYNKVQNHLGICKILDENDDDDDHHHHVGPSSSSSSSISIHFNGALPDQAPRQETLAVDMINANNYHHLVMDYFRIGFEACKICEQLLQIVLQTRENHRVIKRVIKIGKRVHECKEDIDFRNQSEVHLIVKELASYSLLKNPLSRFSGVRFNNTQDGHDLLFKKLKSKYGRTRRRMKIVKIFKIFLGFTLVVSCTALTTAMLILAFHSLVGIMASPALVGCCLGLIKKRKKMAKRVLKTGDELERLGAQIDVAARGVYTLINDFDTMSRLGRRLYDEIEHGKVIADICVRNVKGDVLKEVVRELERHEVCFLELLEEFEEHIYLCLLNINRSKRQIVEEMIVIRSPSS